MKKSIIFASLILLLFLSTTLILAQEEVDETPEQDINISEKAEEIREKAKEVAGSLDERTEDVLQREVKIPDEFKFLYLVLMGISRGAKVISWEQLIVFIITAFIIFIFSLEILEFTAFETRWVKFIIAGGITLVSAIIGIIYKIVNLFYKFLDNFWYVMGGMIILFILLFVLGFFIRKMKQSKKLSKAEELGIKAGAALKGLKESAESAVSAVQSKD